MIQSTNKNDMRIRLSIDLSEVRSAKYNEGIGLCWVIVAYPIAIKPMAGLGGRLKSSESFLN